MMNEQDQIAIAGTAAQFRRSRSRLRSALMVSAGGFALLSTPAAHAQLAANALPTQGTVVAGNASVSTTGTDMTISQSTDRAIINWNSFDVGSGASVTLSQPSRTSIAVNRVTGGGAPSEIAGSITANGRIAILNPNGVLFAGTANVDVGGLIATTGNIDTDAFMGGGSQLNFTGATGGEIVVNAGATISVQQAGLAAFVAPSVRNSGTITARAGRVALGAGEAFTIDLAGDRLLELSVPSSSPLVRNAGSIFAEGGRIEMSARAAGALVDSVVNTGVLDVTSASLDNGTIVLTAAGSSASLGGTMAGRVSVTADRNATIASNISGSGDFALSARHIQGSGSISRSAGNLTLNVNAGGDDTRGDGNFINDAVAVIGTVAGSSTINLDAGTYATATIGKRVALNGTEGATILVGVDGTGLSITASDVSVSGLTIRGPLTGDQNLVDWIATPLRSVGISIGRNAARVAIADNAITDLRTGIRFNGVGNTGSTVTGNLIENTKGGVMLQSGDAATTGIGISGNREGVFGNEWGIVLNLNTGTPLAQAAPTQSQTNIMALSNGNGGMSVLDRAYATANRSHVTVDGSSTASAVDDFGFANGLGNVRQPLRTISDGVDAVATGGTVNVADGTYTLTNTLALDRSITLLGESQSGTIIDSSGQNSYGIRVKADNVTLGNFTLLGSSANVGNSNYGIKIEANTGDTNGRNDNFTIRNVSISGSRKTGLDLNATLGALIDGVTVTGVTAGNGISITDSAGTVVRNSHTSNNAWGGLALYQSNNLGGGGSTQQLTDITVEGNNAFGESNGLYLQDSSTLLNPGTLHISGYDYAVRNSGHRSDGSQFVFFRTTLADATSYALGLAAPNTSSIEGNSSAGFTNVFTVVDGLTIAAAGRDVRTGGTINVGAGTYASGTVINTDGVTLTGATGAKIDATHNGDNGITVAADGVTVQGFEIFGAANQAYNLYNWGSDITRGVVISNGADNVTVTNNNIHGVRNAILVDGRNANSAITNNRLDNTKSGISVQYTDGSNLSIAGNSEGGFGNEWGIIAYLNGIWNGSSISASGGALGAATPLSEQQRLLALSSANGGMAVYNQGYSALNRTRSYVTTTGAPSGQGSLRDPIGDLQAGINAVVTGGTVNVADGTYVLTNTLAIDKSITLLGASQSGTIIDSSGQSAYAIRVKGDDVSLSNFTLLGSAATGSNSNYGIKIEANTGDANGRNDNFTIRNVSISGSRKTGLDLNATLGAVIDGVTVSGVIAGNGISITDSAGTVVRNSRTSNNAWGGLALYQSNNLGGGGSTQQLTNITIEANNAFGESNGLYLQDSSTLLNPGTLNIQGFGYAVRNTGHRTDGDQFVFFRTTLADATAYALGLAAPNTSSIEGNSSSGYTNVFTVVDGLSIAAAGRDVRTGGTINVGAGTYASGTAINTDGVTLTGATGAKIDATHNGDNGITVAADGVTVQGFEIFGAANQAYNLYNWGSDITRGVVISNGADNVTVTNNNIHDVRNAILVDGRNASTAITNNRLDNTKSGISVQYTDGSNLSIAGNSEGGFGNEWGIIAYLNGIWNGSTISASAGSLGAATPLSEQQRLLTLSSANGGMAVYNQGYSALNRTRSYVTAAGAPTGQGSLRDPIGDFQAGVDAVVTGGTVHVASGTYTGNVTLNTVRVLDFGTVRLGALTLGIGAAGSSITGNVTTTGDISFAGNTLLAGDLSLSGQNIALNSIGGNHALTVRGTGAVSFGTTTVGSLTASGGTITAAGITTSGAQSYTGATTLTGNYVTGGGAFTTSGTTNLNGSYTTAGGAFTTSGTTTLAGTYTTGGGAFAASGTTNLAGTYTTAGGTFTAGGANTLTGATTVTTGNGAASFGTLGGAFALGVNSGAGAITLGQATGLTTITATGATISSTGASTSGAQLYTGNTTLAGAFATNGAAFTVTGATVIGGATTLATGGGAARFGDVGGTQALTITAGAGNVTLGAARLGALDVTAGSIVTTGVTTTGLQRYVGATSLTGAYATGGGAFTVTGATTLAGGTTVATAGGNATFETVGGEASLGIDAGSGAIALGQVSGIASLSATGGSITAVGTTTSGAQSYTGNSALSGNYTTSGGAFTATGQARLGNAMTLATGGGNVRLGETISDQALTIAAGAGEVTMGATRLASLEVTAGSIATTGVTTTGAQRYTGATSLSGTYATGGGDFTVSGATRLLAAATIATTGGAITTASIDGGQALTINAGNGIATLGSLGGQTALGATSITAGQTVLDGATYAASSLAFRGSGSTVRLTQGTTTFRTTGGAIVIDPQLIGTNAGQQNVVFVTGSGTSSGDGDISLGNIGSEALRIGSMTVTGRNFTAATVKLAGDFVSKLSGNQTFSSQTLDTLGNVNASVGGNETGPVVAGGAVSITASGGGTGSIIAAGPVTMSYGSDVDRTVKSEAGVSITSEGSIEGSIDAKGAVAVNTTSGAINSAIASTGAVTVTTTSGNVGGTIAASGPVTLTTTSGSVGGTITTGGAVTLTTVSGSVGGTITSTSSVSVKSDTGIVNSTISGGSLVDVAAGGGIGGKITTQGDITLTSVAPVKVEVDGGVVTVNAPSGTVTGNFGEIKTDPGGGIVVNPPTTPEETNVVNARRIIIDTFVAPAGGSVSESGQITLPAGLVLGLIAPAGRGDGQQRPVVLVNSVQKLGELLREGYTAIIIQIDESGSDI